jgi:hypothetical protein
MMQSSPDPTAHISLRGWWDRVWIAIIWRYVTHSVMVLISIMGEGDAAPTLHDRVLAVTPLVPVINRYNYSIWILAYVPIALWLLTINRRRFIEFMYVGGFISLLRGITIYLTCLGPVNGRDINAGKPASVLFQAWLDIVNPISALTSPVLDTYLTKDLFFSGHTASTFLLWLYCRPFKKIGTAALIAHIIVVATVFLSHLHYTIDVIGAWAITFSAFVLFEKWFKKVC